MDESVTPVVEGSARSFTLRKLFGWLTLISVYCWWIFASPLYTYFQGMGVIVATPAILTVGMVYCRDWRRTFCLGGLFPAGAMLVYWTFAAIAFPDSNWGFEEPLLGLDSPQVVVIAAAWYFGSIAFVGLLALGVRWLVE